MKFLPLFIILIFSITACDILNIEDDLETQSNEIIKKNIHYQKCASDIYVNTTAQDDHVFDICDGKGDCNLVDAIETANLCNEVTTIHLEAGEVYFLTEAAYFTKKEQLNGTYQLISNRVQKDSGLPLIKTTIIIEGNGAIIKRRVSKLSTGRKQNFTEKEEEVLFRIIHNSKRGNLTLKNVTILDGNIGENSYDPDSRSGNGGAIYNLGELTVENCQFEGNVASQNGGAIFSLKPIIISNSVFNDNHATNDGGGIFMLGTDIMTIESSTFTQNTSGNYGGAIFSNAELLLTSSNISFNNSNRRGGGIYLGRDDALQFDFISKPDYSPAFIDQCIFESNEATQAGGGIFCEITEGDDDNMGYPLASTPINLTMQRTTISGNIAGRGGGIMNWFATMYTKDITVVNNQAHQDYDSGAGGGIHFEFGFAHMENTVVAQNPVGGDIGGVTSNFSYISESTNFIGDQTFTDVNIIHGNPMLNPLSISGNTKVHIPMSGSPLINAGTATSCLSTDQRGLSRPVGSACDLGAVEVQ